MNKNSFLKLVAFPLLAALMISVLAVNPVLADDGQPPVESAETAPEDMEEGQIVEATQPTENSDESISPPVVEVLSAVPEGTEVVVVNEGGEVVAQASEEAAAILLEGDPMWCPAGVIPGGVGCTTNHATFALLLADPILAGAGPAMNGVIWIRDNYAGADAAAITIDGAVLTTMNDFTLTLQGGWTGVGSTVNSLTPSVFDVRLNILNWNNDVTINDIQITGSSGGNALSITTTKKVVLTRVQVNGNTGGAYIDNNPGTGVTITSSEFKNNTSATGLEVVSSGVVTLTNIVSSGNSNHGLVVNGDAAVNLTNGAFTANGNRGLSVNALGAVTLKDILATGNAASYGGFITSDSSVTLNGTNVFSDNTYGLSVASLGAIKINNLIANSNVNYGADLRNQLALTAQPVTLTGASQFLHNGSTYTGLTIYSTGIITVSSVTALHNAAFGVNLDNTASTNSSGVVLAGTNVLSQNYYSGLYIATKGTITLNNVTAEENGIYGGSYGYGAELLNNGASSAKAVVLNGTNTFNGNYNDGLQILSKGAVTLNNVTASWNGFFGAHIDNTALGTALPQNVTLKGANFFNDNNNIGLLVTTYGSIAISNLTANNNGTASTHHGADLNNSGGTIAKSVTLTGINSLLFNFGHGLFINSIGAISINSVTASNNGQSAATGAGAVLFNYTAATAQAVKMTGTNAFNFNYDAGLIVSSKGAITTNSLSASNNANSLGVSLSNTASGTGSPQTVTMTGTNLFSNNAYEGLYVVSYGAITTNNLTASNNGFPGGYVGVRLHNSGGTIPKAVAVKGVNNFNGNNSNGLQVNSLGAISVSSVTANSNETNGVYLTNDISGAVGGVTMTGTNVFDSNESHGLNIFSYGAITLGNIQASGNGFADAYGYGAYLLNSAAATAQAVTLSGANFFNTNLSGGLYISATGAVKLNQLTAMDNQGLGVDVGNTILGSALPQNVSITGTNLFNANYMTGLRVASLGTITASNLTALQNGVTATNGYGVQFDNAFGATTPKAVTITGVNKFHVNYYGGLYVSSLGAITVSNVTASDNTNGTGATLNNNGVGAIGNVTLSGVNIFERNYADGLTVSSFGAITVSNLTAEDNGLLGSSGYGAELSNSTAPSAQKVTLSGTNKMLGNYDGGLVVQSKGAVTVNSITASENTQGKGVYIANVSGPDTSPQAVTFTGTNVFNQNYDSGLDIASYGVITLNNLTASSNGTGALSGYGTIVYNASASTPQKILLTGTHTFNGNYNDGLNIGTAGAIVLGSVTANDNLDRGGVLYNSYLGATGTVTMTGVNTFNGNDQSGLYVSSNGMVALSNVNTIGNTLFGAYVNNSSSLTPQKVTLSGASTFNENGLDGIQVFSKGLITASSLTAKSNATNGVYLNNDYVGSTDGIIVTGTNLFYENLSGDGFIARSNGNVSLTNATSDGNVGGDGVDIDTSGTITVSCGFMNHNSQYGLKLTSLISITLKGVFTAGNTFGASSLTSPLIVTTHTCP